jgi:peptidoglycan/xylan/chitin deacetylase (PgdA/CDA1 family)
VFATGDVARRYPRLMRQIAEEGHEIACHGDTHRRFSTMTAAEAGGEIDSALQALGGLGAVTSFRAPNLDFPEAFLQLLVQRGFTLDSSLAAYKPHKGHPRRPLFLRGILRVPASTMPSLMRLPGPLRRALLGRLREPLVLFFHPWEFVDMTAAPIPWDCRWRTGRPALETLADTIRWLRRRGDEFVTMNRLVPRYGSAAVAEPEAIAALRPTG